MGFLRKAAKVAKISKPKKAMPSGMGIKHGTHNFSSPHTNKYSIESAHLNDARRALGKTKPYRSEATKKHVATYKASPVKSSWPWPSHGGSRSGWSIH